MADEKRFQSFEEFWPFYLSEHRDARSRRLHFVGTTGFLAAVGASAVLHPIRFPAAVAGFAALWKKGLKAEKKKAPFKYVAGMVALGTAASPLTFPLGMICAYGCAWIGHFGVEHNTPATFKYPLYSLTGDFRMYAHMLKGELWSGDPLEALGLEDPFDAQPVPTETVASAAAGTA
jgi:hypothetical protein